MTAAFANPRPFLTLADLRPEQVLQLTGVAFRYGQAPQRFTGELSGLRVGLLFTAPSTRTRISFWSAAATLGCEVMQLGPADLQSSTGESWRDTCAVLSNYFDIVVARTNGPQQELEELSLRVPATINALTYEEHPTQALADWCAMREHFGTTDGLRVAYVGPINNTARALAWLVRKLPFQSLDVYSPREMGFPREEVDAMNSMPGGGSVRQHHLIPACPDPVDVVYTTRWQSMGVPRQESDWLALCAPFAITRDVMRRFGGPSEAVFMHDMPAVRGLEVEPDILDGIGTVSLVPGQIRHKASAAAAAMLWSMGNPVQQAQM